MTAIGEVVRDLTNPDWQFPSPEAAQAEAGEKGEDKPVDTDQTPVAAGDQEQASEEALSAETGESPTGETAKADVSEPSEKQAQSSQPVVSQSKREPLPLVRRRANVDLKNSEYVIMVSALKGVCGISHVRGFDEAKKFNIQTLSGGNQPDPKKEAEKAARKAAEDAMREEMRAEEEHHRKEQAELASKTGDV